MVEVTKEEFFSKISFQDVTPKTGPERSVWKDQKTGQVIGYTYPGYLCRNVIGEYDAQTKYYIEEVKDGQEQDY